MTTSESPAPTPRPPLAAVLVVLVCAAFAIKGLVLIDRTSLWNDELRTVIKSFQPSLPDLFRQLSRDTHPPLYYVLVWLWGAAVGQSALSLRLFSWLAYGIGGGLMALQAAALAVRPRRAAALAALAAFCSPFPVRFAIEGKGYALLALWVVLALVWRARWLAGRRCAWAYGLSVAAAGLTHYYGLFLFGSTVLWDGWRRRWPLARTAALALLPSLLWIGVSFEYLSSGATADWIGRPEFALLEDTLARALGPWPLPKLGLILVVVWGLRRWCTPGRRNGPTSEAAGANGLAAEHSGLPWPELLDRSGVSPSLLMVLLVVLVSFVRPLAFYRYFFVLVPAVVPALAAAAADWRLSRRGERLALIAVALALSLSWRQAFLAIEPPAGVWWRESNDFRSLSLRLAGETDRYAARPELMRASDRMQAAAGRLAPPLGDWDGAEDLRRALAVPAADRPSRLWLAATGKPRAAQRRLEDLEAIAEQAGYACAEEPGMPIGSMLLECRRP
ncbi:hypothetical protein EVJ50_09535 [Synechococcus sp. RSCCF101]|uniref:hypothetical protein n=1 Tax=Synechococcus sp. RSCCF101 TaxID=2511069 RepID=UPI00124870E1|nr:hypothetical protein [Synechococcus sp. RSCCF101]QEY32423.1 hypothetical protein EVJ50_09535 [Synechococcus sp. RSCCF101]